MKTLGAIIGHAYSMKRLKRSAMPGNANVVIIKVQEQNKQTKRSNIASERKLKGCLPGLSSLKFLQSSLMKRSSRLWEERLVKSSLKNNSTLGSSLGWTISVSASWASPQISAFVVAYKMLNLIMSHLRITPIIWSQQCFSPVWDPRRRPKRVLCGNRLFTQLPYDLDLICPPFIDDLWNGYKR